MQSIEPAKKLRQDLCRLARFGANVADAHSCFIFLPQTMLRDDDTPPSSDEAKYITLAGYHSLSNDVIREAKLIRGNGLVGWVAKHHRSIHVSPFEHDSRTLGMYTLDQSLKSFIGIPIALEEQVAEYKDGSSGVLACDSRKSFAFSKLHGKLLEDLAREVSNTILLLNHFQRKTLGGASWQVFSRRAADLMQALGAMSVEALRIKLKNFEMLEQSLGTPRAIEFVEQFNRLIQQALPPHVPSMRLPNGDTVIVLDNMMTSFYENKVRAMCDHCVMEGKKLAFEFSRSSFKQKRSGPRNIDGLISDTAYETPKLQKAYGYEHC